MQYRRYKPEDFAELYAVEEACFEAPFRFSRGALRSMLESADTAAWVAEAEDALAGFAVADWGLARGGTIAYLQTIEVLAQWRGQGVAAELLQRAEESVREAGAGALWLHVDSENAAAIRLYERHGYVCEGRKERYYPKGRAALIYAKGLAS
ncbi:MAG TPA: N-acetyltransferase [Terracidiphilus sp.]|nr:N-acetyltransferase [Terracidiphilus sp.]